MTWNLRDFPAETLSPYNIEAQDPDEFLLNIIDLKPSVVSQVIVQQAAALRNPQQTADEVLDLLEEQGLTQTVAMLRGI